MSANDSPTSLTSSISSVSSTSPVSPAPPVPLDPTHDGPTTPTLSPARLPTRLLLTGGMVAGPLWGAISLLQAIGREGFDLTRHPLSALGAGTLGWVQITNFVVAGLLFLAGALGLRRVMAGEPGGVWAPRPVGLAGMGMIAAGVLVMDPADGFPVGTPEGAPASLSWHAAGHLMAGALSFLALILACWVLGRNFSRAGLRRHATASRVAGTLLLVGNAWAMSGAPAGSLALAVGGITAMVWVSAVTGLHRHGS